MKKVSEILTTILSDLSDDIPDLLSDANLNDFDEYVEGPSRKQDNLSLCLYIDEGVPDQENESISLIYQLQLYKIKYLESVEYLDIVKNYIQSYDPEKIEATSLNSMSYEHWPIEQKNTTFIYFMVQYLEEKDSCDQ